MASCKAFMSLKTQGERDYRYAYLESQQETSAYLAMREAERILAATEPDEPLTLLLCVERVRGAGRMDSLGYTHADAGYVALAESLAAFLEAR